LAKDNGKIISIKKKMEDKKAESSAEDSDESGEVIEYLLRLSNENRIEMLTIIAEFIDDEGDNSVLTLYSRRGGGDG
jgi:hypothetical protein